jgi:surface antigen
MSFRRNTMRGIGAVAFALVLLRATAATAQSLPLIYGGSGRITGGDMELIRRAAEPLFSAETAGAQTRWANAESGNSGAIRLRRIYELKGLSCRQLLYTTKYRAETKPSATTLDWCRLPSGEWKLVDPLELRGG